jgi:hypothetical protein
LSPKNRVIRKLAERLGAYGFSSGIPESRRSSGNTQREDPKEMGEKTTTPFIRILPEIVPLINAILSFNLLNLT